MARPPCDWGEATGHSRRRTASMPETAPHLPPSETSTATETGTWWSATENRVSSASSWDTVTGPSAAKRACGQATGRPRWRWQTSMATGGRILPSRTANRVTSPSFSDPGTAGRTGTCSNRRSVSILPGAPAGGVFSSQKRLRVGKAPDTVLVADFNNDGFQDLAVVNRGSGDLSVLIGIGGGKFKTESRYGFIGPVVSIAAGDFNADKLVDLAVVVGGHDVYFLKSLGDGSFRSSSTGIGFSPIVLSVGDFNADGKQDLLAAGEPDGVSAWLGRGDGAFVSRASAGSGR